MRWRVHASLGEAEHSVAAESTCLPPVAIATLFSFAIFLGASLLARLQRVRPQQP